MKVLFVWKSPYPFEIRIKKICDALIKDGFDVYLLSSYDDENNHRENINGINVIRKIQRGSIINLPFPRNPIWSSAINQIIKEINPDVIIVREIMLAESTALLGKKYSIPVIMDMAENYPACMRSWIKYNSNFFSRFLMHSVRLPDIVERRAVNLCDGVILVCEEQVDRLHHMYNYHRDRTCVVHNTPFFDDLHGITPTILNVGNKIQNFPIRFCNHGYLSEEKPLTNFLLGFDKIANRYNIEFLIAGIGTCVDGYKELVSSFKNKDKIKFLGHYDYDILVKIINEIDIGVLPFPNDEVNNYTIQNKMFDYMYGGKPLLVGNSLPFKRIIEETKAGLSFDFSTPESAALAIETMLAADTQTMSENGIKAAREKYNWDIDAKVLVDFVRNVIINY